MSEKVLVLRACRPDMSSKNDFVWPSEGEVTAPDWNPIAECGQGLHGWLWGEGNVASSGAEWAFQNPGTKWLVVEVDAADLIRLDGKVKFSRGCVVYCGDLRSATDLIALSAPGNVTIIGRTATAGYAGTATAGDSGTATAGDLGTATAGDLGTATAGDSGTATAGTRGTATAGDSGTATAGENGSILIKRWDYALERYRWTVGEVGIDGIEANVPYKLDESGKLVKA